jgi:hypothetical protein
MGWLGYGKSAKKNFVYGLSRINGFSVQLGARYEVD